MVRAVNRSAHVVHAARWALTGKRASACARCLRAALLVVTVPRFRAKLVAFRRRSAAAGAWSARSARACLPRSASRCSAAGWPAASGSGMGRRNEKPDLSRARAAPCPGRAARQRIAQHAAHGRERECAAWSRTIAAAQQQLDRDCYEYFLFSKTPRTTPQMRRPRQPGGRGDAAAHRRSRSPAAAVRGLAGRSYQDEIVRELARNNCGASLPAAGPPPRERR